ncbi:MAG TPA: SRPBCC domain-containing protein, partial [Burkholderiaceae bacterium]|nr:SRPBCC domain-containing protein [Burkholderiaceae bacterium]
IFFGKPGGAYAAMMASFIYLCPVLVGAVTVYVAERKARRSWGYYLWSAFVANVFFVLGTLLIMVEGLICAIVIVPIFAVIGSVGGLLMGIVCRATNWPRQTLYSFVLLPLILGALEGRVVTPSRVASVERGIVIRAAPDLVWREIMNARDIQPDEMKHAWIFRIGVPLPLAGVVEQTPSGPVRKIAMGKGVHFDQVFTHLRENEFVRWTYRIYPNSFPPYALDDHVVVGGYYFDVRDTTYSLTPTAEGTELRISMGYRVTTQFNWYAEPWAQYLLGNFEENVLDFYRRRSEARAR